MQQRHLQIEVQQPAWILEREAELLKRSSASLRHYAAGPTSSSIFQSAPPQIKVFMNAQCNTRVLYYCLLYLIYECDEAETARNLEIALKSHVYSPLMKLDQYRLQDVDQQYRQVYDNGTLKKLFVEFGQALNYQRGEGRVLRVLNCYPVMDFVLRLVIRGIYHLEYTQPWTLAEAIPTSHLAECISRRLFLDIYHPQSRIYILNNGSIRFIESQQEFTITKPTERGILGELALSTEDSLPIVESFEEELQNDSIVSNNFTPQFHELKGSRAKLFEKNMQQQFFRTDPKDDFLRGHKEEEIGKEHQSKTSPRQRFRSIDIPELRLPEKTHHERLHTEETNFSMNIPVNPIKCTYDPPVRSEIKSHYNKPSSEQMFAPPQQFQPYITSGMTSPQVLKLMKPKIMQDLNEKKKRSMMHLMKTQECASQHQFQKERGYKELSDLFSETRHLETDRALNFASPHELQKLHSQHVNRSVLHEPTNMPPPLMIRHSFGGNQPRLMFPSYGPTHFFSRPH